MANYTLIFFGLTITSIIVALVLYFSFDVPDIYIYLALGVAGISFITTIAVILLSPSQRQIAEQEYARKQKSRPLMTLEQCNKWKCNEERGFYIPREYKMLSQRNRDICKCEN